MTQEHALQAYKHYKKLLEGEMKPAWRKNAEHAIDSIEDKWKRKHIEIISEEEEIIEEKPIKSKGKK